MCLTHQRTKGGKAHTTRIGGGEEKKTTEETFHHLFDTSGNAGYGFANCNEIQDVSGVTVSMGLIYEKDLGHKETIVG